MLKAVLFDLDGVLVDACELHRQALNFALRLEAGYEIPKSDLHLFEGRSTRVKLQMLVGMGHISADLVEAIKASKQTTTVNLAKQLFSLDMSKIHLFTRLKMKGIKIGVVSNAVRETVDLLLELIGVKDLVDVTLSNEDVERNKPDPEGYLKAMKILGVNSNETVIIEDSEVGVKAAKATGAKVVVVDDVARVNWGNMWGLVST